MQTFSLARTFTTSQQSSHLFWWRLQLGYSGVCVAMLRATNVIGICDSAQFLVSVTFLDTKYEYFSVVSGQ